MIHIFQPPPDNALTGGYIYNARMSAALAEAQLHEVPAAALPDALAARAQPGVHLIVDSLYLGAPAVAAAMREHAAWALVHHLPACDPAFGGDRSRQERAENAWLDAAPGAIATSAFMRSVLIARGRGHRVLVCPPGVDDDFFAVAPQPAQPPELVTVANLEPRKGLLEHIAPVARAAGSMELRWYIIGAASDPGYAARMRDAIDGAGLASRVTLCGRLERAALCERLARATAHLFPSRFESYGMAVAESLAAGVPVVAPAVGELPALISDGETGLLAPPGDADALAESVATLLGDAGLQGRLRAGCAARRSTLPRWAQAARQLADALAAEMA